MELEVRNLSERLTEILRDSILSGEIGSGVAIRQDALAARLKVSKIPLREALARLEQDGLVRSQPNRGFFVSPLSAEEAEEVFALRLQLEPDMAALACDRANDRQREDVKRALNLLDADRTAEKPNIAKLNRGFHLALIRPAARPITLLLIERLHVIADRYVHKHLETKGRDLRAEAEHGEILNAWLDRNSDGVKAAVRSHLEHTLADLREQLATSTDEGSPSL